MNGAIETVRDVGVALTPWAAFLAFCIALVRIWPSLRKIKLEGDTSLRGDLLARIAAVEAEAKAERENARRVAEDCDQRIDRIVERHDKAMDEMKAEIRVMRHDRNNVKAGFNALLAMIKRLDNPDLSTIAETVEEMVSRGDQAVAIEKANLPGMKGERG